MAVATFDTLKFANTLKAAGVPAAQAEAEAVAFAEIIQVNLKELVTKDDLKRELDDMRKELKQEIKDSEQRVNIRVDALAAEEKTTRAELKGQMYLLKWMVGVGTTVSITLTSIVVRLLLTRPW